MRAFENRRAGHIPADTTLMAEDLKDAYAQGRRDERANRTHHPFIAMAVVVLALIGGVMVFLAAREGSFSTAGQVADQKLAVAAAEAGPAIEATADRTGEALKDAGANLRERTQNATDRAGQPAAPDTVVNPPR